MTIEEKQTIAATARKLIYMLENCDDGDFVDDVISSIASADTFLIEVENL